MAERLLRDAKYELPGSGVERLEIDAAFVADPAGGLARLLAAGADRQEQHLADDAVRYAARFAQVHGVSIRFEEGAAHLLAHRAQEEQVPVRDLCDRLFKDYQFGLKLIQNNTGQASSCCPPPPWSGPTSTSANW